MAELGTPTTTPSSDDTTWRASIILKSTVHAPATARTWVRHHLAERGLSRLTGDAALLVCELVTNVYRHAEAPEALVEMAYFNDCLRVEVSHQRVGDGIPHIGNNVDDGGRGLLIVEAYSDDCGVVISAKSNSVWFTLKS